ncbi:MAG TPA: penicillin-binding transpeptidase domain-containing protein [Nocardioidaceae bacterium]|nr:penicillin-binding transpeptidase domain-containing protein [Nocardioidaceae bacterium]
MTARRVGMAAAAVTATLAAVLSACTSDSGGPQPPDDAEPPGQGVIQDFAAAWRQAGADAEVAAFRGIVDRPKAAVRDITALVEELAITGTQITLTDDLTCSDDDCRQHADVTHQLAGVGPWSYQTLVKAARDETQWRVQWSPGTFNPDLTEVTTLVRERTVPPRAAILDRNGIPLTPERAIVRIGVQPSKVRPATYDGLASLLDINAAALRDTVASAQPNWFVPVIDLRRPAYRPLRESLQQLPGILLDSSQRPLAPTAEWGRAVLGTVGPATSDSLKNAGPLALPTDEVGSSGLQYAYQRMLAGRPGSVIALVEKGSGGVLNRVLSRPPRRGQSLATTLDVDAQDAAERAVARATDTTAVVVVKASTGEILAAANGPGATSYNTAFVGRYAPGSTFKVVSAAALLAQGELTPGRLVDCPDTTVVDGKSFKNYEPGIVGPRPTFADAFAASCNTTMVEFADDLSGEALARAAERLGVGAAWDLGLPAFSGSAPADTDLVTRAADMIGQGRVEASPLAMAMVAAAVDSGVSRTPTLLPDLQPGLRLTELEPTVHADLQRLMRLVVTEGTAASLDLPGLPVYAKTGTAEYEQDSGRIGTNAWLIGYRGDIAFSVLVENGSSGSQDAAPVVAALLAGLPPALYG